MKNEMSIIFEKSILRSLFARLGIKVSAADVKGLSYCFEVPLIKVFLLITEILWGLSSVVFDVNFCVCVVNECTDQENLLNIQCYEWMFKDWSDQLEMTIRL